MKKTEKKKPVSTIPEGVWESSRPNEQEQRQNAYKNVATDLQGNGYPKQDKER